MCKVSLTPAVLMLQLLWPRLVASSESSLPADVTSALQSSASHFSTATIKCSKKLMPAQEARGPRIDSELVTIWFENGRFRQKRVVDFIKPGGGRHQQNSEEAFDGSVYYLASHANGTSVVTRFLGANPTDSQSESLELTLDYLSAVGLEIPKNVAGLRNWQSGSSILQAETLQLESVDESHCIQFAITNASEARKSSFKLDAEKGYAIVSRIDLLSNRRVVWENSDFSFDKSTKIWYPRTTKIEHYVDNRHIYSILLKLKSLGFGVTSDVKFDIEPTSVGSLIADRSDPASSSSESGQVTYRIGAGGQQLRADARLVAPRNYLWLVVLPAAFLTILTGLFIALKKH